MDITTGMVSFQRFQDDGYKNWIKTTMGLQYLKTRLGAFLENETETYHQSLRNKLNRNGQECKIKCDFRKGDLKKWNPSAKQKVPPTCGACVPWGNEIWANHSFKGGLVYWSNCTPYLWPTEKWEVAKVYMGRGNTSHKTVGDFDISAFLVLMTNCLHFKQFVKSELVSKVTNVRNQVMHSANFLVKKEDLESHLDRIRGLGKALEKHAPQFQALAKEIDELQNIDFDLILCRAGMQQEALAFAASDESLKLIRAQQFLCMELNIMKEKMECLAQCYEDDRENVLTLEDLQCVKGFLEGNRDLQERLVPQWERLREVQEQQGEQLDSLTDRVEELEKKTLAPEQKSIEFSTDIIMYKNFLFEDARKHGWPEPVFFEKRESTGYKGQVKIKGKTFTGLQVCRSKTQAHQEVAKIALEQLAKETANDQVDVEASVSQTHQSESVSPAGSSFFGSVIVVLDTKVVPDEGCPGTPEAVESAYKKLAPLFGLELSESASSYKEAVLQYCQRRDVPPPKEISESDCFSLRVNGPITFHDSEGSSNKKQAQRQAAKAALQGLSGVLGKKEVLAENYVGALKELLDSRKIERVVYDVTARAGGAGKGGMSVGDEEKDGQGGGREREKVSEGRGERRGEHAVDELSEREKRTGGADGPHQVPVPSEMQMDRSANNQGPKPSWTDTSVSMETRATPATQEERSISEGGGRFLGCVKVPIKKELEPCEASSQEGAVQAAYRSLLHALSLGASAGGEKQSVMEFFTQTKCRPPMEELVITAEGIHRCTLKIDGEIIFQSPEGAAKKQQAEHLAAKEALRHLGGLLDGKSIDLSGEKNYKGKLQELLVKHGSGAMPDYSPTVGPTLGTVAAPGQVTEVSSVIGSIQQTDVPSVSHAVTMETGCEDSEPFLTKKWAPNNHGPKPSQTDTPIPMETQDTQAIPEEKSTSQDGGRFLGCVKVAIKKELAPCEASSQEGAVQAAYRSLLHALSLGASAGGEKQSVMEFFTQTKCRPPMEELVITAEGIHRCTLKIDEGAAKKQQAEHLAAKEALRHLGGLLEGKSIDLSGEKNYKGKLQELLVKHGSGAMPDYSPTVGPTLGTVAAPGQVTEVSSVIGSIQQADVPSISHAVTMDLAHEDSEPPPSKKLAEMQSDGPIKEVRRYLALLGLQPQSVVCESVIVEQQCEWRVCVSFECFTLRINKMFDSKRDASRNSFLTLGLAGEICQPEESKAKEKVNQFFLKHSFPLPKEALEEPKPRKFTCSLTDITCVFTYTAKGSSEASARQSACQQALSCISPLIGYCGPVALSTSTEEVELRLRTLLEEAGLKLSDSIHTVEYRSSATLKFSGYCMETMGHGSKKETRNKLSQRLLKLLQGEETLSTNKDHSMKHVLEMWFVKCHLDKPMFEDTDNKFGTRVTFSAPLHCSCTDWQDSQEKAVRRLVEELQRRVQNLSD